MLEVGGWNKMENKYWHKDMEIWKTILCTGFIKSTIGTSFISIGVALIFNGAINSGVRETFYLYGIISVLVGCVIYFVGDMYKRQQEEKNVEIIQSNTESYIQAESERIKASMKKIIEEEETNKENAIKRRFDSLEKGICEDVADDNPNIKKYCQSREVDYTLLIYPTDFPMKEIMNIGRQKAIAQGEIPNNKWMKRYVDALYNGGFIHKKQHEDGLLLLGDMQL